ncbi:hypothetical protein Pelo_6358 [Pelomyxa schiedti]|nr:hypothetical protein Pelo_6358 [Pelomyxa schiedti]
MSAVLEGEVEEEEPVVSQPASTGDPSGTFVIQGEEEEPAANPAATAATVVEGEECEEEGVTEAGGESASVQTNATGSTVLQGEDPESDSDDHSSQSSHSSHSSNIKAEPAQPQVAQVPSVPISSLSEPEKRLRTRNEDARRILASKWLQVHQTTVKELSRTFTQLCSSLASTQEASKHLRAANNDMMRILSVMETVCDSGF